MEKVWIGDVFAQYPGQWVVMTDLNWAYDGLNRKLGYIYGVYKTWEAAREVMLELEKTMSDVAIVEGYDETPHIGGLFV
ncbi:MAG: hypothetical protein FWG65_10165 [Turicibacter sp.]|nr:hypothetical protein [Turicibacter sp.]